MSTIAIKNNSLHNLSSRQSFSGAAHIRVISFEVFSKIKALYGKVFSRNILSDTSLYPKADELAYEHFLSTGFEA